MKIPEFARATQNHGRYLRTRWMSVQKQSEQESWTEQENSETAADRLTRDPLRLRLEA
ncbi:MAG TPA: hypothetical protein VKR43_06725 [Bryobacteraceae bacterium]|nr:hypothetical protein [Bryobacteraceae bacterium]